MPKRSGIYIRADVTDSRGLTVKGQPFDAVTVEPREQRVTLHIGGLPTGAQGRDFPMPADPSMLRDLVEALRMAADDVEAKCAKRGGPPGWRPPVVNGDLYGY
jgi:hypothetical protein